MAENAEVTTIVRLRPVEFGDLQRMYELQCDPESNRLAVTNPRTRDAFDAHWAESLNDPQITARVILLDDVNVGYISCFPRDGLHHVGYWIDRVYWGRGIASEAVRLLVNDLHQRPLHATIATSNAASLRVLQKSGFIVEKIRIAPACDRYPECEEATLVLAD